MKHVIPLLLFILLLPATFAQTPLRPGETEFLVDAIVLVPVKDYTDVYNAIGLWGDLNYLNIFWNATYYSGEVRDIGVKCYLNCPDPGDDIDRNCTNYGSQLCDPPTGYLGPTGRSSCTIVKPRYLFKEINNVICKFYDPANPSIEYIPTDCLPYKCYINITFWPINFSVRASDIATTVGKSTEVPITVQSFGLLNSSFTVNITASNPSVVSLVNAYSRIAGMAYGQVGRVYPAATILASVPGLWFRVLVKSDIEPVDNFDTSCTSNSDCSHYGSAICMNNRCWKELQLNVVSGKASLPEFDVYGLLQILFLATIVLYVFTAEMSKNRR